MDGLCLVRVSQHDCDILILMICQPQLLHCGTLCCACTAFSQIQQPDAALQVMLYHFIPGQLLSTDVGQPRGGPVLPEVCAETAQFHPRSQYWWFHLYRETASSVLVGLPI